MTDWTEIVVPNGKHAGKTVEEIPSDYLSYIIENWSDEEIVCAAEKEMAFRSTHDTHWQEEEEACSH